MMRKQSNQEKRARAIIRTLKSKEEFNFYEHLYKVEALEHRRSIDNLLEFSKNLSVEKTQSFAIAIERESNLYLEAMRILKYFLKTKKRKGF